MANGSFTGSHYLRALLEQRPAHEVSHLDRDAGVGDTRNCVAYLFPHDSHSPITSSRPSEPAMDQEAKLATTYEQNENSLVTFQPQCVFTDDYRRGAEPKEDSDIMKMSPFTHTNLHQPESEQGMETTRAHQPRHAATLSPQTPKQNTDQSGQSIYGKSWRSTPRTPMASSLDSTGKESRGKFDAMKVDWRRKSNTSPSRPDTSGLKSTRRISENYKGDVNSLENQGANIPAEQSCALHLTNLPPDCTISDLLGAIRGIGKVYASNMRPPTGEYQTSAAKLVFWDRDGVTKFLDLSSRGKFTVGRYVPEVKMNDHRVPEQRPSQMSRVLQVWGPKEIVRQDYLEEFFRKSFDYDLDDVCTLLQSAQSTRLEFRFSSYRCQASNAYKYIIRAFREQTIPGVEFSEEEQALWRGVRCFWGIDPCA
ncbi:hypothetical protein F4779DRAFT_640584 [Xylariaceae sp. FL0662B]|nr:hypothetical protein F4779DRAFT_640584 [Xylariaceae sp. FL0662B]